MVLRSVHRVGGVYNGEIQPVRLAVSVYSSRDDGLDVSLDPLLLSGHVRRTIITLAAHFLNVYSKSLKVLEEVISQSFAGGRPELGEPNELLPETCFICIVKSKAERLYWMLADNKQVILPALGTDVVGNDPEENETDHDQGRDVVTDPVGNEINEDVVSDSETDPLENETMRDQGRDGGEQASGRGGIHESSDSTDDTFFNREDSRNRAATEGGTHGIGEALEPVEPVQYGHLVVFVGIRGTLPRPCLKKTH
ncbi:hypothetical protein DPMN_031206 [Dreissena polymorpha]|uniref:Uncharacterized protein n=1 Tax=Dreissena polymorpha TaxID=45954 RepID=A0A9D4LZJ5_DREPO|nr:hypothetical protein DPMN_031206 [Dreissena polymorpha]